MPIINISVINKRATGDDQILVNDNNDYVVKFTFDSEWDDYPAKTMRVVYANGDYRDVVFNGTEAPLPILRQQRHIRVGVYAGDIHTTAEAHFDVRRSILDGNDVQPEPSGDIYNEIMEAINSGMLKGVGITSIAKTSTEGLVDTYTITYSDGGTSTFTVTNGEKGADGITPAFSLDPETGHLIANYSE